MLSPRTKSIAVALVVAIVALTLGALAARAVLQRSSDVVELQSGTVLTPPRALPPMNFVDHQGRTFDAARVQGRWTLLFFGFTHCPDVCPATLSLLTQAAQRVADLSEAERPQIVLFSVDPERDTPDKLAQYVTHFRGPITGVTGNAAQIEAFTRNIGVPTAKTSLPAGGYTVDHSAAVFLLDPQGALRVLFSPPHSLETLAADYRRIVQADARG